MLLEYYKELLGNIPSFMKKYLRCSSLKRLKKIGYFCGMDYASKDIYDFKEFITRYDHSVTVALITYRLTNDKTQTIAALFHDVATPCFSHVIDYMNKDYENQETTEEYTEKILRSDKYLISCLEKDSISLEEIVDFKRYPIVDNKRPKVCADRIDGVILTGISWTKNIDKKFIYDVVNDMRIDHNEIGFTKKTLVKKIVSVSKSIDVVCHSKEDHYMMELLADITRYAISKEYIKYEDLYILNEEDLFKIFKSKKDDTLNYMLDIFYHIKKDELPEIKVPSNVKVRDLKPLVGGERYEG